MTNEARQKQPCPKNTKHKQGTALATALATLELPQTSILQGWQRIQPLPPSGSERRLFRLGRTNDASGATSSAILIDARRDIATAKARIPYLQRLCELTNFLTNKGLRVPRIEAVEHAHSMALVEDLGEESCYAHCLSLRGVDACHALLEQAADDLTKFSQHACSDAPSCLPAFDEEFFVEQTSPFTDAFFKRQQRDADMELWQESWKESWQESWQEIWRTLYRDAAFEKEELAPVLGDVHVENMFALARGNDSREKADAPLERCVFIDFQDAHWAPRCYDIVSLLEDGLWSMPQALRERLWQRYCHAFLHSHSHSHDSRRSASRHYALCALHREVRMIGILYRLLHTRGTQRYGAWLTRSVRRCERRLAEEPRFSKLQNFLQNILANNTSNPLEEILKRASKNREAEMCDETSD